MGHSEVGFSEGTGLDVVTAWGGGVASGAGAGFFSGAGTAVVGPIVPILGIVTDADGAMVIIISPS